MDRGPLAHKRRSLPVDWTRPRVRLTVALCLVIVFRALPCTVFSDSQDGVALVGRNWDMSDADVGEPVMWVVPAQAEQHGRICFGRHGDCEDGMNDQGLCVAVAATPPSGGFKSRHKPVSCPQALDELLAT